MFDTEDYEYDKKHASQEEIRAREEFEFLKPSLMRRLEYINESGRNWEFEEDVENIKFYLEVMKDPLMMRTHGVDQIRNFVTSVHNIEHRNPLPDNWKPKRSGKTQTASSEDKYESESRFDDDWGDKKKQDFEEWIKTPDTHSWEQQNTPRPSSSTRTTTERNPTLEERQKREEYQRRDPTTSNYQRSCTVSHDPIQTWEFSEHFERRPRTARPDSHHSEQNGGFVPERNASERPYFFGAMPQQRNLEPVSHQRNSNERSSRRSETESYSENGAPQQGFRGREQSFMGQRPLFQQSTSVQMNYSPNYAPSHPPMYYIPTPTFVPVAVPVHMPYYESPLNNRHRQSALFDCYNPQRESRHRSQHHSRSADFRQREYPPSPDYHRHRVPFQSHRTSAAVNNHSSTTRPASPPPPATPSTSTYDRQRDQIREIARMKAKECFEHRSSDQRSKRRSSLFSKPETREAHPSSSKTMTLETRKRGGTNANVVPVPVKQKRVEEEPATLGQTGPAASETAFVSSSVEIEPELEVLEEFECGTTKISEKTKEIKEEKVVTPAVDVEVTSNVVTEAPSSTTTSSESQRDSEITPTELSIPETRNKMEKPATVSSSIDSELELIAEFKCGTTKIKERKGIRGETGAKPQVKCEPENQNDISTTTVATPSISIVPEVNPPVELNKEVNNEVQTNTQQVQNVIMSDNQDKVEPNGDKTVTDNREDVVENSVDIFENCEDIVENTQNVGENHQDIAENCQGVAEIHKESQEETNEIYESRITDPEPTDHNETQQKNDSHDTSTTGSDSVVPEVILPVELNGEAKDEGQTETQPIHNVMRMSDNQEEVDVEPSGDPETVTDNSVYIIENREDCVEHWAESEEDIENQEDVDKSQEDIFADNHQESQEETNEIYESRITCAKTTDHRETQLNQDLESSHQELQYQQDELAQHESELLGNPESSPDSNEISLTIISCYSTAALNPSQPVPQSPPTTKSSTKKQPNAKRGRPKSATKEGGSGSSRPATSSSSNPPEQPRYSLRNTAKRQQQKDKEAPKEPKIISRLNVVVLEGINEESRKKLWKQSKQQFKSKTLKGGKSLVVGRNDLKTHGGLGKIKVERDYIPDPPTVKTEAGSEGAQDEEEEDFF